MDEAKEDYKAQAAAKYNNGNFFFKKNTPQDYLSAIDYYIEALRFLRYVDRETFTTQDLDQYVKNIQLYFSALIVSVNKITKSYYEQSQALSALEKFLTCYLDNFQFFYKAQKQYLWMDELNLEGLAGFVSLLKQMKSPDAGRAEIYMGIVTLFHQGIKSVRTFRQLPGDSEATKEAFALYQRALKIAPKSEEEDEQKATPAAVSVEPPEKKVKQKKIKQHQPGMFFAPESEGEKSGIRLPVVFDYIKPDLPKRECIAQIMAKGTLEGYEMALAAHPFIMNRRDSDFRTQSECQQKIGDAHFSQREFQLAKQFYTDAITSLSYVRESSSEDQQKKAQLEALVKTLAAPIVDASGGVLQYQ